MGNISSKNDFEVNGKTVAITGGSRGMGLEVARQLAEKGANVVIIARDQNKLREAIEYTKLGALNPSQRFHQISADLTSASESVRVIDEITEWNGGNPPDTVWCCAGSSYPTLFIDTPVSQLQGQMESNYLSAAYMAHATLRSWLKPLEERKSDAEHDMLIGTGSGGAPPPARHLIFTASFLAFYSFAGYAAYSPSKSALRSLSDTLSQEMNLYAAAYPHSPPVRLHTIFPATILTESYEAENRIKHGLTKSLEDGDEGQTPQVVASRSIKALQAGEELISTDLLTGLVKNSMLGGSVRGGFLNAIIKWILAGLMGIVMVFVRGDMDRKTRAWGRKHLRVRHFTATTVAAAKMTKNYPASTPPKKQINLLRGWPNTSLLPTAQLQKASNRVYSDPSVCHPSLLYGPDPGPQSLRESIAKWLRGFYSDYYAANDDGKHADRICITGGASQNLACLLQVYSDPVVTTVWMVTPTYYLAGRIFDDSGLVVRAVGEGSEGVDLESLEKGLREGRSNEGKLKPLKSPKPWSKIYKNIIYCVPTFSNPSGKTMSLACRTQLVRLAREYDALLITDDVYDFLQWSTNPNTPDTPNKKAFLPRLVDIDRILDPIPRENDFGNAVSNGSFSKIVGPGVRTGWAEATPKLVYGLSQTGSSRSGGCPSQLTATIVNELLSSGDLEKQIYEVLQPAYRQRWRTMMSVIEKELAGLGVKAVKGEEMFGGYFLWLVLPEEVDGSVVTDMALQKENLVVAPGKIFEVVGDESVKLDRGLRLCFAWEEEDDLAEGVTRLARVVRGIMDRGGLRSDETHVRLDFKQALGEFS
ncbi:hypothetical protein CJF30_00008586 [Rutstroemia sp. NJR-2017a BBW]|nr:hypothetical protein CJF30_00008586 [Rutstroemia sp. NJR-2017a BBW]